MTQNVDMRRDGRELPINPGDLETLIDDEEILTFAPFISPAFYCSGWAGAWVYISIDSTGSPTNVRILAQFRVAPGNPNDWADFEEGLWASLYWEFTDTADGILKAFNLPFGGNEAIRFQAIAEGADQENYFDVTVRIRPYYPAVGMAHA